MWFVAPVLSYVRIERICFQLDKLNKVEQILAETFQNCLEKQVSQPIGSWNTDLAKDKVSSKVKKNFVESYKLLVADTNNCQEKYSHKNSW
jgi:hypothetical protein